MPRLYMIGFVSGTSVFFLLELFMQSHAGEVIHWPRNWFRALAFGLGYAANFVLFRQWQVDPRNTRGT